MTLDWNFQEWCKNNLWQCTKKFEADRIGNNFLESRLRICPWELLKLIEWYHVKHLKLKKSTFDLDRKDCDNKVLSFWSWWIYSPPGRTDGTFGLEGRANILIVLCTSDIKDSAYVRAEGEFINRFFMLQVHKTILRMTDLLSSKNDIVHDRPLVKR